MRRGIVFSGGVMGEARTKIIEAIAEATYDLDPHVPCEACRGAGSVPDIQFWCSVCDGTGSVPDPEADRDVIREVAMEEAEAALDAVLACHTDSGAPAVLELVAEQVGVTMRGGMARLEYDDGKECGDITAYVPRRGLGGQSQ